MPLRNFFKSIIGSQKRIYLDYAAATPVHQDIFLAMRPYFSNVFGNPSAIHREGVTARAAIDRARNEIAHVLKIRDSGIVFTGSGTEANNLALFGVVQKLRSSGKQIGEIEIITTALEHPSILEALNELRDQGHIVHVCPVDADGRIDIHAFETLLNENTALISFAYVNSEIGVIQDVKRITRMVRNHNVEKKCHTLTHLDAAQAPLWLPVQMDMLGVDLLSLDAGKCYGPKGVGVLAFRHGVSLTGIIRGGGQESGLRAGTENTPLIIGCVAALVRAQQTWHERSEKITVLRDYLIDALMKKISGCVLNGSAVDRVANNVNISIPGIDSEFAVVTLDVHRIACSTKSACSGASGGGSVVVAAISNDDERARSTIRFSLGEESTQKELDRVVVVLTQHVQKMRTFARRDVLGV